MIGNIIAGTLGVGVPGFNISGGAETKTIGGYKYCVFTGNGNLTVSGTGTVEIISAGGGGGGGHDRGGGGGGGELDILTSVSASDGIYTVVVGGAGANGTVSATQGVNGGTSTFALGGTTYVTSLGGGGSGASAAGGLTGGSGGGGARASSGSTAGGGASGSNTNAGGTGGRGSGDLFAGGGGGGATAVGGNIPYTGSTYKGGNGGQGYTLTSIDSNLTAANFTSLTGMTVICSGAGGGAYYDNTSATVTAGLGGTGAGNGGFGNQTTSTNATDSVSYGSGGAGGKVSTDGKPGIAGVVIARIAV